MLFMRALGSSTYWSRPAAKLQAAPGILPSRASQPRTSAPPHDEPSWIMRINASAQHSGFRTCFVASAENREELAKPIISYVDLRLMDRTHRLPSGPGAVYPASGKTGRGTISVADNM